MRDTGIHEAAELHGDATLNGKFGLALDGSGDYLTASGDDVMPYASSGEFGISMWFTRRECLNPGRYQMLVSLPATIYAAVFYLLPRR